MKVFIANTPPEAHIVCELLRTHGIECEVRGEGLFGLQGEIPFGEHSDPYVWLLDLSHAEAAQQVIQRFTDPVKGKPWLCTQCSEWNEVQFSVCWNCSASVPLDTL